MKAFRLAVVLALAGAVPAARAIAPESGMYWTPDLSGRGIYIEHQNGFVGVAIYAFNRDTGDAEIYLAGGPLRDDGTGLGGLDVPIASEGFFPMHWFVGELSKARDGQPLTFPDFWGQSAQADRVGIIQLGFFDAGSVFPLIQLDNGESLDGVVLERYAFGHARYADAQLNSRLWFDLLGEWVFVDVSDPAAPALRFNFTQREPASPPTSIPPTENYTLVYIDPARDARLVCADVPEGDSGNPEQPRKRGGCELFVGEEIVLAANRSDVGLDRIQAYRGSLPPHGFYNPYRRPETVIGLRVVTPPPSEPEGQGKRALPPPPPIPPEMQARWNRCVQAIRANPGAKPDC